MTTVLVFNASSTNSQQEQRRLGDGLVVGTSSRLACASWSCRLPHRRRPSGSRHPRPAPLPRASTRHRDSHTHGGSGGVSLAHSSLAGLGICGLHRCHEQARETETHTRTAPPCSWVGRCQPRPQLMNKNLHPHNATQVLNGGATFRLSPSTACTAAMSRSRHRDSHTHRSSLLLGRDVSASPSAQTHTNRNIHPHSAKQNAGGGTSLGTGAYQCLGRSYTYTRTHTPTPTDARKTLKTPKHTRPRGPGCQHPRLHRPSAIANPPPSVHSQQSKNTT